MRQAPCVRIDMTGALIGVAAAALVMLSAPATSASRAARVQEDDRGIALTAALNEFQRRLDAYLDLREGLSRKLKPLTPTADTAELTASQEALAAAMKRARANARHGDLVPPPVAVHISEIVTADFKRRNPTARQGALQEVPERPRPVINRTYPAEEALPTVPPLLLAKLPKLPDNLQYRFFGRHVVILDGDLQIITDYVENALPPH